MIGSIERLCRLALLVVPSSRPVEVQNVLKSRRQRGPDGFDEVILALMKWRFPTSTMAESLQLQLASSVVYRRDRLLYFAKQEAKLIADRDRDNVSSTAPSVQRLVDAGVTKVPQQHAMSREATLPGHLSEARPPIANRSGGRLEYKLHLRETPGHEPSLVETSSTYSDNPHTAAQYPNPPKVPAGHLQAKCTFCCKPQSKNLFNTDKAWRCVDLCAPRIEPAHPVRALETPETDCLY